MTIATHHHAIHHGGCLPPPCKDPANPTNASTRMEGGQAVFENDNYRITAGDNNTVTICNKHTGETYQAWGDPHMKIDGQQAFDFWGTTTLKLEDGTKVTIETTPWDNNPNMTLSSKITITNGDYGAQISGIDTNKTGDLHIDETTGWGSVLDAVVKDGNTIHENPAGQGFLGIDGDGNIKKVDQNYINDTDLLKGGGQVNQGATQAPGADRLADFAQAAFQAFSGLMSMSFLGGFLSGFAAGAASQGGEGPGRGHHHDNDHGHRGHHGHRDHCHPSPLALTLLRLF